MRIRLRFSRNQNWNSILWLCLGLFLLYWLHHEVFETSRHFEEKSIGRSQRCWLSLVDLSNSVPLPCVIGLHQKPELNRVEAKAQPRSCRNPNNWVSDPWPTKQSPSMCSNIVKCWRSFVLLGMKVYIVATAFQCQFITIHWEVNYFKGFSHRFPMSATKRGVTDYWILPSHT